MIARCALCKDRPYICETCKADAKVRASALDSKLKANLEETKKLMNEYEDTIRLIDESINGPLASAIVTKRLAIGSVEMIPAKVDWEVSKLLRMPMDQLLHIDALLDELIKTNGMARPYPKTGLKSMEGYIG